MSHINKDRHHVAANAALDILRIGGRLNSVMTAECVAHIIATAWGAWAGEYGAEEADRITLSVLSQAQTKLEVRLGRKLRPPPSTASEVVPEVARRPSERNARKAS